MIARTLFATAALGLALAAPGHAASTKDCGLTSRIDGVRYQVIMESGTKKVSCTTVKRVATKYLRSFDAPRPWHCQLGHSADDWAASCARSRPSAAFKIYAPG